MAQLTTENNDPVAAPICGGLKPLKEAKLCASKAPLTMQYTFLTMGSTGTLRTQKTHCGEHGFFCFKDFVFLSETFDFDKFNLFFRAT